jgi:hypothetical protein
VPLRIRFMGLFDTVASVGYADSFPVPVEGHQEWGDQDLLPIPAAVEQCVHFVAGHEGRNSFPVDLVLGRDGRYASNCLEVIYPGVHSDVGGGYAPREQGKGVGAGQDDMLSQIPLNDMYERALKAGVPLRNREKLDRAGLTEQFSIGNSLRHYYDHYLSTVKLEGKGLSATRHYETHLRYYLHWRREVLSAAAFSNLRSVGRATRQQRINLTESNDQFRRYVGQMERADSQMRRYEAAHDPRIAPPPPDTTGLAHYRKYWPKAMMLYGGGLKLLDFFDHYVHDSRAGFTIVDPVTFHDHWRIHQRLKQRDAAYRRELEAYEAACPRTPPRQWMDPGIAGRCTPVPPVDPLTPRERQNLAIYEKTKKPEEKCHNDRQPGTYDDGKLGLVDVVYAMDKRREARWSYLHPRQHFAYSRLAF